MNKKAFTLMELLLVVAIVAIFAASSIPFLMNSFGGFNQITNQEAIINRLQEVSTVIIRRVTFDNHSTNALQTIIDEMQTNNGITVANLIIRRHLYGASMQNLRVLQRNSPRWKQIRFQNRL